jgi:hypothetical protein
VSDDETTDSTEITGESPAADPVSAEPFVPPAAEPFPATTAPSYGDAAVADEKPELIVGGALVGGFLAAKILKALGNG